MFEEIEHTADYAVRVRGTDLRELFVEAARGMNALTGGRPGQPSRCRELVLDAPDAETLLVSWLEELVFLMEVEGEIVDQFEILGLTPTSLKARLTGGPAVDVDKAVKAVTFHELAIRETGDGYETTIVFDV